MNPEAGRVTLEPGYGGPYRAVFLPLRLRGSCDVLLCSHVRVAEHRAEQNHADSTRLDTLNRCAMYGVPLPFLTCVRWRSDVYASASSYNLDNGINRPFIVVEWFWAILAFSLFVAHNPVGLPADQRQDQIAVYPLLNLQSATGDRGCLAFPPPLSQLNDHNAPSLAAH